MSHQIGHPHSRLLRRLSAVAELNELDRELIRNLPMRVKNCAPDYDVVRQGETTSQCCLVVDGLLYRQKEGEDGKRQILSFYVSGDIPDLHSLYLPSMDHTLTTAGPAVVAFISHEAMFRAFERSPSLQRIMMREIMVDASVFREWLLNIGTRQALPRVAHLICEIASRMRAVDAVHDHTYPWPLSQGDLGDACGISAVHTNRVIQELRARDLIAWKGKALQILDWDALVNIAEFSPAYLYLDAKAQELASRKA